LKIESYGLERKDNLVATIGKCEVLPGASNVIPGEVRGTIDIRSHDEVLLSRASHDIYQMLENIGSTRNLQIVWKEVQRNAPVYCNPDFNDLLAEAIQDELGTALKMSSGAGHDGVAISKVAPISMLFVRSKDGLSHHPDEYTKPEDIADALAVSISFLEKLKNKFSI